jgi:hypothetical protein
MVTGIATTAVAGCDRVSSADEPIKGAKTIPKPAAETKRQRVFYLGLNEQFS